MNQITTQHIQLSGSIRPAERPPGEGRRYEVTIVESGTNDNGWEMPVEVLEDALIQFVGAPCMLNHHPPDRYPDVQTLAGVIESPCLVGGRAEATLRLYETEAGDFVARLFDTWLTDLESDRTVPPVGLSTDLTVLMDHEQDPPRCVQVLKVWSVDVVMHPAAGGRVERALNHQQTSQKGVEHMENERNQTVPAEAPPAPEPGIVTPEPPPAPSLALQEQMAQLTHQVEELTARVAEQVEPTVVQDMGLPAVHHMRSSLDQVVEAVEALLAGMRPRSAAPLTGVRELYHLMSGDFEMTGLFRSDRVRLANVNSATMAGLVANALNKRVVNLFQEYPAWWAPAVNIEDFASLQDVRWITLGGIGELPTVAEGAAYTELTWDDQTETDAFVKKGGYLGITLECIDKDDTARLRAAPRALAQSAWLTLSKAIAAIHTANSGCGQAMSDTNYLYDSSNHANLGSTALSASAWKATKIAMMKQTELNSGERLGALTAPYLIWVPVDLADTAAEILATGEGQVGSMDYHLNVEPLGNALTERVSRAWQRVVTVPVWTDTSDWIAQANPQLYPSIGLGFRYGRTPEIFSVASPTAGLMFTNDTLPIKVRFFFAVGPTDWRGLYKHIVT